MSDWEIANGSEWESVDQPTHPLKSIFSEMAKSHARNFLKNMLGSISGKFVGSEKPGLAFIPAIEQIPTGAKEGVQSAVAALGGGEAIPSAVPDEYGASLGRGLGRIAGQGAIAAPIAGAAAFGGEAIGIPALLSQLGGLGIGYGATTEGNALDRIISGGEAAALGAIGKAIPHIPGLLKSGVGKAKEIFSVPELREELGLAAKEAEKAAQSYDALKGNAPAKEHKIKSSIEGLASKKKGMQKEIENISDPLTAMHEGMINEHENLLQFHNQNLAKAEEDIAVHLNRGQTHDVKIAEAVVNHIEGKMGGNGKRAGGVKQQIGQLFENIENNLSDKKITIPNDSAVKALENDIANLLKGIDISPGQYNKTFERLVSANKPKVTIDEIPANEFLSNYRTVDKISKDVRSKAYEVGITEDERAARLAKADALEEKADQMFKVMESHGLGDELDNLRMAQKRWKEEITPLYKNKSYQRFLNQGEGAENIMKALRGNTKGNLIIKNIIKSNPELLKNVVGQRYARNVPGLHELDDLTEEYVQHMPELQQMRETHGNAMKSAMEAKETLNDIQAQKPLMTREIKRQQRLSSLQSQISDIDERLPTLEREMKKSKQYAMKKDLSLKEKIKAQDKAKSLEERYNNALKARRKALIGVGVIGASVTGATATLRKMGII